MKISSLALEDFSNNVQSLWSEPIPTLSEVPSSLEFLKNFVSLSKPCILQNVPLLAGGRKSLTIDDLCEDAASNEVNVMVDVTPDGYGDCVRTVDGKNMFVMPQEKRMSLEEFKSKLRCGGGGRDELHYGHRGDTSTLKEYPLFTSNVSATEKESGSDVNETSAVYYYSRQNDCLRQELPSLHDQNYVPPTVLPLAEAFASSQPEAINIWIGNAHATSSMHKDFYENLYYVCSGEKTFVLCPPCEALVLKETEVPTGRFGKDENGKWCVHSELDDEGVQSMTRWIESDVEQLLPCDGETYDSPSFLKRKTVFLQRYPMLTNLKPIRITIKEGEMLYLPALWYHKVSQSCETVAVNYWYDMRFDSPR